MRSHALLAAAATLAAASPALASNHGLDHIDHSADVVVRLDVPQLSSVLERASSWNVGNRLGVGLIRSGLEAALGFDPMTREGWKQRGIDAQQPMWLSLQLDGGALEELYERLLASDDWSARRTRSRGRQTNAAAPYWRVRVVMTVTDTSAALGWIQAITPALRWSKVGASGSRVTVGQSAASGVWIFERSPAPGLLVLDIVRPAFGAALAAPPIAQLRRASAPPARASSFGALKRVRAASALRLPGTSVWLRSTAIAAIGRALAREAHVAEVKGRPKLRAQGPLVSEPRCVELGRIGGKGLFEDLTVRVTTSARKPLRIDAIFGGEGALLGRTFPRARHALDAHRRKNVIAWAAMWSSGPAGLRALPRSTVMRELPETLRLLRQCSVQHVLPAQLFAWPELIGLFFDEIAGLGPRASTIASDAAGASAAVAVWARDPMRMTGVLEGSLSKRLSPIVAGSLTRVFGESRDLAAGRQWGRGRLRPYIRDGRVGTTFGGDAGVEWLARTTIAAEPSWLRGNEIAAVWLDLSRSASALSQWQPLFVHLEGAGSLRSRIHVDGDRLALESEIGPE